MNNLFKGKGEASFLLKPVLFLFTVLLLLLIITLVGFGQVKAVITKTADIKKNEIALNQKVAALENVSRIISGDTTFLDVVLPSKSAVLYGLSQIKNQSAQNNLIVSNVRTGAAVEEKPGISKTSISFDVEGDETALYSFLKSFSNTLPLMKIEKIKISKAGNVARATTSMYIYSAELPKTIPSVSSTINTLTEEEIKLLTELSTYTLPVFVEPKPNEVTVKEDPFN